MNDAHLQHMIGAGASGTLALPSRVAWFDLRHEGRDLKKAELAIVGWIGLLLIVVWVPSLHFVLPGWVNVTLHRCSRRSRSSSPHWYLPSAGIPSIATGAVAWPWSAMHFSASRSSISFTCCRTKACRQFLTPSGGGKAISFFLAARLLAALALLGMSLLAWERQIEAAPRNWLFGLCLAFALTISLVGLLSRT